MYVVTTFRHGEEAGHNFDPWKGEVSEPTVSFLHLGYFLELCIRKEEKVMNNQEGK